jgi:STAS domain
VAAVERASSASQDGEPFSSSAAVVVTFPARVARASIPEICEQVQALLGSTGAIMLIADTKPVTEPDLAAVEAIFRLKLIAGRRGCTMRLVGASPRLLELLAFAGLPDIV